MERHDVFELHMHLLPMMRVARGAVNLPIRAPGDRPGWRLLLSLLGVSSIAVCDREHLVEMQGVLNTEPRVQVRLFLEAADVSRPVKLLVHPSAGSVPVPAAHPSAAVASRPDAVRVALSRATSGASL